MASGGKRGGGDRILESRHLVGLFLGVVLLCGVFFTLGYVMGRTQYGGSVHAEALPTKAVPASATKPVAETAVAASVTSQDWDFSDRNKKTSATGVPATPPEPATEAGDDGGFSVPPVTTPAVSAPLSTPKNRPAAPTPKITKGSFILQVAALRRQSDAVSMANILQKKHFPAFVDPARGDALYHVQVGPYADERAADSARTALDHDGFKVIIKR